MLVPSFRFLISICNSLVSAQNQSFQKQWLKNEFTWLSYSIFTMELFANGALCLLLRFVSRSAKPPGSLVSGPHCNYKKAKEHHNNHQNCHYRKLCAAMFDNFVQTDVDKSRCERNALNSSPQKTVEENRNRLYHIIRTIEFAVAKKYH